MRASLMLESAPPERAQNPELSGQTGGAGSPPGPAEGPEPSGRIDVEASRHASSGRAGDAEAFRNAPSDPPRPRYDFSTGDVDTAAFPYASWARINR